MGLDEIRADAVFNQKRIAGLDLEKLSRDKLVDFVKTELAQNVYPLIDAVVEAVQKELGGLEEGLGELDEAVEILEQRDEEDDEDVLQPETAQQILGVLQLGRAITVAATPFLTKCVQVTDEKRKRLKNMIMAYSQGLEVVAEIIVAITVKPEPEDADQAEDGDGEGVDEDQDAAEPAAAAGAPVGGADGDDDDGEGDDEDDGLDDPEEG